SPQVTNGRTWQAESNGKRAADWISDAISISDDAAHRSDHSISAGSVARMERGPGPGDIRRLQRPGFPECVQGFAAAARVATTARFQERAIRDATPLDRLGWRWPLDVSNTQRTKPRQCACDRAGAWRRKLATAGVR